MAVQFVDRQVDGVKQLWRNKRRLSTQSLRLAMIFFSALVTWKSLAVITNSESPIVAVLSASMEPTFRRGDILFLTNGDEPFRAGEVVVFKLEGRNIPIVHRIIRVHERPDGSTSILTKGDNNWVDDRALYGPKKKWLSRKDIVGRAKGALPGAGMVTVILSENPIIKFILMGLVGLMTLTGSS